MSNQEAAIFMHLVKCYDVSWLSSVKRSFMGPWLHKPCGAVITKVEELNRAHRGLIIQTQTILSSWVYRSLMLSLHIAGFN